MPLSSKKKIIERCRELRRRSTKAEDLLWQRLRNRKLDGMKFNRQFPLIYTSTLEKHYFFVADFYCHQQGLVLEVDGAIHEFQKEYDEGRDTVIMELGLKVLRFTNEQVESDMNEVISTIRQVVRKE